MEADQEDDILFSELINESLAYQSRYHQTDILDTETFSPAWRPKDRVSYIKIFFVKITGFYMIYKLLITAFKKLN